MCAPERRRRATPPWPGGARLRQTVARGLSVVELMVGIVVSLLVGLAAIGSALVFGQTQRQGAAVGTAAQGGNAALASMRNDAALAGLGFFGERSFLCERLNLSALAVRLLDGEDFAPLRISPDGSNVQLDVLHAQRVEAGANVLLGAASDGTRAELASLAPAAVGDAVLLSARSPGAPCVVRSVTAATPAAGGSRQLLQFGAAGLHNQVAFSTAPAFAEGSRLAVLGELRWQRYRLQSGNLLLERPLVGGDAVVVARNVVALRAEYGVTAAGASALQAWQPASGAGFAPLQAAVIDRISALRIGLVLRSPQREKPDAGGNCRASEAKPELWGAVVEPDVDDWRCWRFRTVSTVVPLRNFVMGLP